jgi:UDP-N-acetylmuramate dehydrogenase
MKKELSNICEIEENFDLKKFNTYKLNSVCDYFAKPKNAQELKELIKYVIDNNIKYFVLGNGSNIILPIHYDGVVIYTRGLNNYKIHDEYVYAESGCMINALAIKVTDMGYSGLDFATGIPGTIGGSIYMNAGCFGSDISNILISAEVFDGKNVIELSNEELKYGYRTSMLKTHKDYIVLSCKLKIEKGNREELKALVTERTNKRIQSQDLSHPSAGSVFRNPEGMSAGKLIDDLGLKGYSVNDAMVSYKHANFIINNNDANQEDVINLINEIKSKVKEEYNVDLILEQEIIK